MTMALVIFVENNIISGQETDDTFDQFHKTSEDEFCIERCEILREETGEKKERLMWVCRIWLLKK